MAQFRFALGSVLRLRRTLEHQQYLALEKANQQVSASHQRIENAVAALECSHQEWAECAGATSAELRFAQECRRNARLGIEQARRQHSALLAETAKQRDRYVALKRDSEALEELRDSEFERWQLEEARREQQRSDELFLLRLGTGSKLRL